MCMQALGLVALVVGSSGDGVDCIRGRRLGAASVSCGSTATIGYIGPTTGPVASIGEELRDWPLFYVSQWNATHKLQIKVVEGDDQFDPSQASTIAQQFASNADMLGVLGPGSSTEVSRPRRSSSGRHAVHRRDGDQLDPDQRHARPLLPHRAARLAAGPDDRDYMTKALKAKKVAIFDDQGAYSKPLADAVQALLKKRAFRVYRSSVSPKATDYSSAITTIPSGTRLVYTPFTNPANMQLFGRPDGRAGQEHDRCFAGDSGYSADFHFVGAYFSTFAPDIRDIPADKARSPPTTRSTGRRRR